MPILEHAIRLEADAAATGLNRRLLTRRDYRQLVALGSFTGERVELIEGELVTMSPIGPAHGALSHPFARRLEAAFGEGYAVRNQSSIALGGDNQSSEPEPDIVVAVGAWRDYFDRLPEAPDIKLIVEIADRSLAFDRTVKAALYAAAAVPEYWIVNLIDRVVEVHRLPDGHRYTHIARIQGDGQITPLFASGPVVLDEFLA